MLTRQEAETIYDAGRETVVRVLLEMSRKIDQFAVELADLKSQNTALRERVNTRGTSPQKLAQQSQAAILRWAGQTQAQKSAPFQRTLCRWPAWAFRTDLAPSRDAGSYRTP